MFCVVFRVAGQCLLDVRHSLFLVSFDVRLAMCFASVMCAANGSGLWMRVFAAGSCCGLFALGPEAEICARLARPAVCVRSVRLLRACRFAGRGARSCIC